MKNRTLKFITMEKNINEEVKEADKILNQDAPFADVDLSVIQI